MNDLDKYIPALAMCDVDTICAGFDEELICTLYREYVNISLPRNYSVRQLAARVKVVAQEIVEADEYRPIIEACDVDTLCIGFEYAQLCDLYYAFTGRRVVSSWAIRDVAKAVKEFVQSGNTSVPDTSELSVDDLKKFGKTDLILIWESLLGMQCNRRMNVEDLAWAIWNYHADVKRTADLTKNLW